MSGRINLATEAGCPPVDGRPGRHTLRVTSGTEDRVPPGLTAERVGFFTDAVFAIAITLLVIDIAQPGDSARFAHGDGVSKAQATEHMLSFLYDQLGSFLAYLLAFFILWIVWREHHQIFDQLD